MPQERKQNPKLELTFSADLSTIEGILAMVQEWAHDKGVSYDDRLSLRLVLEELLSNICLHGAPASGLSKVVLTITHGFHGKKSNLHVLLCDNGQAFNPLHQKPPILTDIQTAPMGQQGLSFVHLFTHSATYTRREGNEFSFIFSLDEEKKLPSEELAPHTKNSFWSSLPFIKSTRTLWKTSLAFRQTVLFTFFSIILFWGGIATFYYNTQKVLRQNATELATQTLQTQSFISSAFLQRLQSDVDDMARNLQRHNFTNIFTTKKSELTRFMETDLHSSSLAAEIPVMGLVVGDKNTTWMYLNDNGTLSSPIKFQNLRAYAQEKNDSGTWKLLPIIFDKDNPHASIIYAVPFIDNDPDAGFVGVIVDMPWISYDLKKLSGFENAFVFYINLQGHYLIFPPGRQLGAGPQYFHDEVTSNSSSFFASIGKDILAGNKGVHALHEVLPSHQTPWDLPWQGATTLAYAPLEASGWFILLLVDSLELGYAPSELPIPFILVAILGPLAIACVTWTVMSLTLHPLHALMSGIKRLSHGDTETPFPTGKFPDELHLMLSTFERVRVALRTSFRNIVNNTAHQQRLNDELALARSIQKSMLPSSLPQIPGTEIAAYLNMAHEVCGDLYASFTNPHNPKQIYFVIGDVCSKGVPAALIMSRAVSLARSFLMLEDTSPAHTLERLNASLLRNDTSAMFVSMLVASLDTKTGTFQWASAGHPPPLLNKNETTMLPWSEELVLNVSPNQQYTTFTEQLIPGQSILLYTDGASEAIAPPNRLQGQIYGEDKLKKTFHLACAHEGDAQSILTHVHEDILHHMDNNAPSDDISLMLIRWHKSST